MFRGLPMEGGSVSMLWAFVILAIVSVWKHFLCFVTGVCKVLVGKVFMRSMCFLFFYSYARLGFIFLLFSYLCVFLLLAVKGINHAQINFVSIFCCGTEPPHVNTKCVLHNCRCP